MPQPQISHSVVSGLLDDTCGRISIDLPVESEATRIAAGAGQAIRLFLRTYLCGDPEGPKAYRELSEVDHSLVGKLPRK